MCERPARLMRSVIASRRARRAARRRNSRIRNLRRSGRSAGRADATSVVIEVSAMSLSCVASLQPCHASLLEERRGAINHTDGWSIAAGRDRDRKSQAITDVGVWQARPAMKSALRGPRTEVPARDLRRRRLDVGGPRAYWKQLPMARTRRKTPNLGFESRYSRTS
jgi:hypothetical protein